jgi:hypothetical protein
MDEWLKVYLNMASNLWRISCIPMISSCFQSVANFCHVFSEKLHSITPNGRGYVHVRSFGAASVSTETKP